MARDGGKQVLSLGGEPRSIYPIVLVASGNWTL